MRKFINIFNKKIKSSDLNQFIDRVEKDPSDQVQMNLPDVQLIQNWIATLNNIENDLNELNEKTEPQFLFLGNQLNGFVKQSNDIASNAIESASALSGAELSDATYDLEEMLERISRYLQYCDSEFNHNFKTLSSVLESTGDVDTPLEGFNKIVKKLHMLGVTTRIENARSLEMENSNFENLSHDVLRMSDEINQKSIGIKQGVAELVTYSSDNLSYVKSRNEQRGEQAQHIVNNMQSCLNTLREKHDLSSQIASDISDRSHQISSKINNIVMSMQFHDICRQRLEHVIEAIGEQRLILTDAIQFYGSNQLDQTALQKLNQICLLQQIQLGETEKSMTSAVQEVVENLSGVYEDVALEAELTENMVANSGNDNQCSLDLMEKGIGEVEQLLNSNVSLGIEINEVIQKIAKMVDCVSHHVVDINFIGSEIELIAMNGLISAAHMGEQGAALSVVADAIQGLSSNAREQINRVASVLETIGQSTQDLRFGLANENDKVGVEGIVDMMVNDLEGFISTFKNVTVDVLKKLDYVNEITTPFKESLQIAIENIHTHEMYSQTVNSCICSFRNIVEQLEKYVQVDSDLVRESFIETLEEKYTMHDEREAHESFIQKDIHQNTPELFTEEIWEKQEVSEGELGDNVELF